MKSPFLPLCLLTALGLLSCGLPSASAELLLEDDFQSYGGSTRPSTYIAHNFPQLPDDPNNAVIGAEFNNPSNKVLRMATGSPDGLAVADFPRLTRNFAGMAFGSDQVVVLEFDYRNHGTASSWLYLGLTNEGSSHDVLEAVMFNGSAMDKAGGFYIRDANLKRFPQKGGEDLRNVTNAVWYHVRLEVNLKDKTVRLSVQDKASGDSYVTDWIPCRSPWNDGDVLDQFVIGCVEGAPRARYKFELDNLKVSYEPIAS